MFNLTIIFDSNYVEPALITALDLHRFTPADWDVTLIFIESGINELDSQVFSLLNEHLNQKKINAISLKSKLFAKFDKFHFTNSILYKLIVPEIVEAEYILNVDAGFLSGNGVSVLFEYCNSLIDSADFRNSPVAAVCSNADLDLPEQLRVYSHNPMYPAGWLLFFNKSAFKNMNFFDRIISGYHCHKDELLWAEQDLLCLITTEGEIANLDLSERILIEQLTLQDYTTDQNSRAWSSDFMLYKITGTLKPWKLWVFDYKKLFYLSRRDELIQYESWKKSQLIIDNWYEISHEPLYRAFLAEHEKKQRANT